MSGFIERLRRCSAGRAVAASCIALLLQFGCGGGVGTGGTGSFAAGPITGFGSIIVAGVRFDDSAARVEADDGSARPLGSLRLGMIVEIDAGAVVNAQAPASQVRVASELIGRVETVDVALGRLTVNGQPVRTQAATVFDASFGGGLTSVPVGTIVEVYGFADRAAGGVLATRIEPRPGATSFKFRGEVSAHDRGQRAFAIGSQLFSYDTLSPPPASLADGDVVRVDVLPARDANGRWPVIALRAGAATPGDVDVARIEGVITHVTGAAGVRVNGLRVDTGNAVIAGGPLAVGQRVAVVGVLRGGVLQASDVRVVGDAGGDAFELRGPITALDPVARTFRVAGRAETVSYARPDVEYDNGSAADIANGRRVEVRGVLAAGGAVIEATRIHFDN